MEEMSADDWVDRRSWVSKKFSLSSPFLPGSSAMNAVKAVCLSAADNDRRRRHVCMWTRGRWFECLRLHVRLLSFATRRLGVPPSNWCTGRPTTTTLTCCSWRKCACRLLCNGAGSCCWASVACRVLTCHCTLGSSLLLRGTHSSPLSLLPKNGVSVTSYPWALLQSSDMNKGCGTALSKVFEFWAFLIASRVGLLLSCKLNVCKTCISNTFFFLFNHP